MIHSITVISSPPCDAGKPTTAEGNLLFYGKPAYLRQFTDGTSEVCQWDYDKQKWFYLLFAAESKDYEGKKVFSERFVEMDGQQYYMRTFYDGSTELSRYDEKFKNWLCLYFPPNKLLDTGESII